MVKGAHQAASIGIVHRRASVVTGWLVAGTRMIQSIDQ
jgi:hypothetical protein